MCPYEETAATKADSNNQNRSEIPRLRVPALRAEGKARDTPFGMTALDWDAPTKANPEARERRPPALHVVQGKKAAATTAEARLGPLRLANPDQRKTTTANAYLVPRY
jgi:hypothetical protein